MAVCNIEGVLKLVDQLYQKSDKDSDTAKVLKALGEDINYRRAVIQQASSFAGSARININKPFEVVDYTPTPAPVTTPETKVKSRKFGDVTAYFYPKGSKILKGALAFTRNDENGNAYIVMQEGITKKQVISYLRGKDGSKTSVQKSVVNEFMLDVYGVDLIGELNKLNDADIRKFIIKHELSHIRNADNADVYYANKEQTIATDFGKANRENNYLADSAIKIETRANLEALALSLTELTTPDYSSRVVEEILSIENSLNSLTEEDISSGDVDPRAEETAEPVVNYTVTGNMTTNEGQTKAINAMIDWFKGNKSSTFMLQGRGGTGKTTVINVLLKELGIKPSQVIFAAPTNKAKKVLKKANSKTTYADSGYYTVAQLLGVIPKRDNRGNQVFKEDPFIDKPGLGQILVVDEASMLHSTNYEALIARAKKEGTRIIFMGDNAQLPPIGDPKASVRSVVFADNLDNTSTLTQLMRQEEDSPIIVMTDELIAEVNKTEKELLAGEDKNSVKAWLVKKVFDGAKLTKFDINTNEGVVLTDSPFEKIITAFLRDYKKSPKTTKYINFNNHMHPNTLQKNKMIREQLYGDKATEEMFISGEPLVLNSPYKYILLDDDTSLLDNGEEFTVVSSRKVSKNIKYQIGKRTVVSANPLEVYEIIATDNVTGQEITFDKPTGTKVDLDAFIEKEKAALVSKGKKPGGAYMLIDFLADGLSHGYIINSHKSQGSTYDNVYMDLGNIAGQPLSGANDIIKSLYVAASRPRKKLVVIDTRDGGNQLDSPSDVAVATPRPSAFDGIDNAELDDIIDNISKCKGK